MVRPHRIVLSWRGGYRLAIESAGTRPGGALSFPLPLHAFQTAELEGNADEAVTPALCYSEDPAGLYEPLRLRENTDYEILVTVPSSHAEAVRRWEESKAAGTAWPFVNPRLSKILRLHSAPIWREEDTDAGPVVTVAGSMNFRSFVGTADLSLGENRALRVEVASSKLGYFEDFKDLLSGVSDEVVELLFEIDSAVGLRFEAAEPTDVNPSVELFHLRRLMAPDALPLAVETIMQRPHARLASFTRSVHPARAGYVDPREVAKTVARLPYRKGGPAADIFFGMSPTSVPETIRQDTIDTPENRYVKAFLINLSGICHQLAGALERARKSASLREVRRWTALIDEWLEWPAWSEVNELTFIPSNSQVLLRKHGYREVLEADLTIQYSLRLPWERGVEIAEAVGDIRPIYELYEYWCYFTLREVLRTICGPEAYSAGDLYVLRKGGLQLTLRRGKTSRLKYSYSDGSASASVYLFYNRHFRRGGPESYIRDGTYSSMFKPDFSVVVQSGQRRHWLHFDAKYRLDLQQWTKQVTQPTFQEVEQELVDEGAESENSVELPAEQPEDVEMYKKTDLYKMHTYRDAILGSRGAYVLYPGSEVAKKVFVRHRTSAYRDRYNVPSIGAFPLRPRTDEAQKDLLAAFLKSVFRDLADPAAIYQEESGLQPTL